MDLGKLSQVMVEERVIRISAGCLVNDSTIRVIVFYSPNALPRIAVERGGSLSDLLASISF